MEKNKGRIKTNNEQPLEKLNEYFSPTLRNKKKWKKKYLNPPKRKE